MNTIFLNNKYTKKYYDIIKNAKVRFWDGYTEVHHIVPRCLGGTDDKENLVVLNGHEHLVCHLLLRKMLPDGQNNGVIAAAWRMANMEDENGNRHRVTGRMYAKIKEEFAKSHSATMKGRPAHNKGKKEDRPEVLDNIKEAAQKRDANKKTCEHCGRIFTPSNYKQYHGDKCEKNPNKDPDVITVKTRGQKRTAEQRANLSKGQTGVKKGPMRQSEKTKRSVALKGKKKREGHGASISATVAKQKAEGTHYSQRKLLCLHCGTLAASHKYNPYHGDNCCANADGLKYDLQKAKELLKRVKAKANT